MSNPRDEIKDLPDTPCHPVGSHFPSCTFGGAKKVNRSFQSSWCHRFSWVHYDNTQDLVFCFSCCKAAKEGKVRLTGNEEKCFVIRGLCNWKDATRQFTKHESSVFHKQAVDSLKTKSDVAEMLSSQHAEEKKGNRQYLLHVIMTIRFLACQGLALRGDGDEKDSNFLQLLMLRAEDNPNIKVMLEKKRMKYTCHEIQNEILSIMAKAVLRKVVLQFQSSFFTVMIDETTDIANTEQVVLVFRWVNSELSVHEEFLGLYRTESLQATSLVQIIKDVMLRLNLKIGLCRGQCYDGASIMSGTKNGVAKLICNDEPRAVYTHCYGHALNLAVNDMLKQCRTLKSCLETVNEIIKLVKNSPKRDAEFQRLKQTFTSEGPGIWVLCPTRWTVCASSLQSILDTYEVLLLLWEECKDSKLDSETRTKIIGVETQILSFEFLFGISLGALILSHSDNLSKTLQHVSLSAAEGQHMAKLTLQVLKSIRQADKFDLFYQRVLVDQQRFKVNPPILPQKRRAPRRFEIGSSDGDHHSSPCDFFRMMYYEALDLATTSITERFDQPGYKVYQNLEALVLKVCRGEKYDEHLDFVCEFYGEDFDKDLLKIQLPLLHALVTEEDQCKDSDLTIHNIVKVLANLSIGQQVALSQIFILMKLLLVMPATNATSERSFSALRRIK